MEFENKIAFYSATLNTFAKFDSKPKNFLPQIEKGKEYIYFCQCLAQGWMMDFVAPNIIVNEFGDMEDFDKFKERHPTFEEDIRNVKIFSVI